MKYIYYITTTFDSVLARARSDRNIIESKVDEAVEVLVSQGEGELGGVEF